jgi:hypothetical protein
MQGQNVMRMFFFFVFFSIGAASLALSALCGDLVRYYHSKYLLTEAQQSLEQLKSLDSDYDVLLGQFEKDPNLIKRIAPATLGTEPADTNAIYPKVKAKQLAAARKALSEDPNCPKTKPEIPGWLARCSQPRHRVALFLASAALIFISFMFFRPVKQLPQNEV